MKPESLIFDIDGTIWDSRSIVMQGYNQYLESAGLMDRRVDEQDLKALFGRTIDDIGDVIFAGMSQPERRRHMRGCIDMEHLALVADPCQVAYPGVAQTLEALAKRHRLFLVSNAERGYPQLMMEKLNLTHLFQGHLCFGDTGLSKGETIRILMERHGITSAVYIGDTQGDLEASQAAGIPFVFCRYGFGNPQHWDFVVDSFPELEGLWK